MRTNAAEGTSVGWLVLALILLPLVIVRPSTAEGRVNDGQPLEKNIRFEEVTKAANIHYFGPSWGVSWGDFDDDGRPDIWLSNHGQQPSLYLNAGDDSFKDIAPDVVPAPKGDTHGAAWADFDNDGDQDLIELVGANRGTGTGANHMFINTGKTFVESALGLGVDYPKGRGRTPLWLDWNNDSRLDVLLANGPRVDAPTVLLLQTPAGFVEVNDRLGQKLTEQARFAQLTVLGTDKRRTLFVHGAPFHPGIFRFHSGSLATTALDEVFPWVKGSPSDVAIADFDGDLATDFFLVKGNNPSDILQTQDDRFHLRIKMSASGKKSQGVDFSTKGSITLHIAPTSPRTWTHSNIYVGASGRHPEPTWNNSIRGVMSITLATDDASNFGFLKNLTGLQPALLIGFSPQHNKWQIRANSVQNQIWGVTNIIVESTTPIMQLAPIGFTGFEPRHRNRLLIHDNGRFVDRTMRSGLAAPDNCHSVSAGDFDNDMDVDLYLVCSGPLVNLPKVLYQNLGDGRFIPILDEWSAPGSLKGLGESVAVADYDLDGFLDLFVTNGLGIPPFNNGPHQLYRNLGNDNHWLQIDLVGTRSNRDGIGAKLLASTGRVTQLRIQGGGMHSRSQNFQRVHYGLGKYQEVDRLIIEWPSGVHQELCNIPADRVISVREEASTCQGKGQG